MSKNRAEDYKKDYKSRNKDPCPLHIKEEILKNLPSDEQKDIKIALGIMNELVNLIETDDK